LADTRFRQCLKARVSVSTNLAFERLSSNGKEQKREASREVGIRQKA
jgi:hypothetical protein